MDNIERTVDDGINTFKSLTKDGRFVPGAGATEIELARQLASYGEVYILFSLKVPLLYEPPNKGRSPPNKGHLQQCVPC